MASHLLTQYQRNDMYHKHAFNKNPSEYGMRRENVSRSLRCKLAATVVALFEHSMEVYFDDQSADVPEEAIGYFHFAAKFLSFVRIRGAPAWIDQLKDYLLSKSGTYTILSQICVSEWLTYKGHLKFVIRFEGGEMLKMDACTLHTLARNGRSVCKVPALRLVSRLNSAWSIPKGLATANLHEASTIIVRRMLDKAAHMQGMPFVSSGCYIEPESRCSDSFGVRTLRCGSFR